MKVLLVEDDPSLREGMAELLSELADVVPCETVEGALAILDREVFEVVLTDLRIGGAREGGRRIVSAARVGLMPVVILSALVRDEIEAALEGLAPDEILPKPFQLEDALAVTDRYLDRRRDVERCAATRPDPALFQQHAPGVEFAVLSSAPDREIRWFRIAADARAEWTPRGREISLLVSGSVEVNGARRHAGQALYSPAGSAIRLYAPEPVFGVSVCVNGARG